MNYIYDIYLNFNQDYFDFYEWSDDDALIHVKKIPLMRISTNHFKKIASSNIEIDNTTLETIKNRTDLYTKGKNISALILTDAKNAIALRFDNNGISIERSALSLDDEFDILHFSLKINESNFKFKTLNKISYILATRKELQEQKYLLDHIHKISYDILRYMYYDCFNKDEEKKDIIIAALKEEIVNNFFSVHKMYNILNPISIK